MVITQIHDRRETGIRGRGLKPCSPPPGITKNAKDFILLFPYYAIRPCHITRHCLFACCPIRWSICRCKTVSVTTSQVTQQMIVATLVNPNKRILTIRDKVGGNARIRSLPRGCSGHTNALNEPFAVCILIRILILRCCRRRRTPCTICEQDTSIFTCPCSRIG